MKANELKYTIVHHDLREKFNLSFTQYAVLDLISCLSNNGKAVGGWCYASKQYMADRIGISKRHVITTINYLIQEKLIEKHFDNPQLLKAKSIWLDEINNKGKQTSPSVNNIHQDSEQDSLSSENVSPQSNDQTSSNNNSINKTINKNNKNYFLDLFELQTVKNLDKDKWIEWCEYRKDIKKKLTVITAKSQLEFLSEQPYPNKNIDASIRNGWTGIFETKGKTEQTKYNTDPFRSLKDENKSNSTTAQTYEQNSHEKQFQVN